MDTKLTLAVVGENVDLWQERRFPELESLGFVRGFTALDQWFLLVNDAWKKTKLPLNENLRDYLVIMLHRHMVNVDLLERLSAFHYLEYLLGQRKIDAPATQEVADMCIQCVSFFPNRTRSRHEMKSYSYVVEVGVSLYQQLARQSEDKDDWYSQAFRTMADSFGEAVMVLQSTFPKVITRLNNHPAWYYDAEEPVTDTQAHKSNKVMEHLGPLIFEDGPQTKQ